MKSVALSYGQARLANLIIILKPVLETLGGSLAEKIVIKAIMVEYLQSDSVRLRSTSVTFLRDESPI